nr:hypothetical protein CFP56_26457 [Quercus suber]
MSETESELYVQTMRRAQNGQGNPVFTCQICVEPMQSKQIFNNNKKCAQHAVCRDCIAKYIQAKIDAQGAQHSMPWLELQPVFGPSLLQENHPETTLLLHELQMWDLFLP